jgi:DNA-binding response OmpR family regulator
VIVSFLWNLIHRPQLKEITVALPIRELRRRVKIVVVDDDPHSFPIEALQADGYTVEQWQQLDASRLRRLEEGDFDIIILDIQDVCASELSDTGDGLGVLRRVKAVNPSQIIVAFSGRAYDLGSVPFWKLADDALRKPVTLIQCKELLDRLMSERITVQAYWQNIRQLLEKNGVPPAKAKSLEVAVVRAVQGGRTLSLEQLRDTVGTIEALGTVFGWVKRLIAICTMI